MVGAVVVAVVALVVVSGIARSSPTNTLRGADVESAPTPAVARTTVSPDLTVAVTEDSADDTADYTAVTNGSPTATRVTTTTSTTTTTTVAPPPTAPILDDAPAVVARPIPVDPPAPPRDAPPAPWADDVVTTGGGHVSTTVGCARDLSAPGLDEFFAQRVGPVIGWDYQHVYPLGGDRYLWLFQDAFVDHSNTAETLDAASFVHNAALVQDGSCFRLLHGGTPNRPLAFEPGTGTTTRSTWFWPMGGEVHDGRLHVFWARMVKDRFDPQPPDGLGWHPDATFVGTYDPSTLTRLDFRRAPVGDASPIYGYTVQSQGDWTYLFGNTFEQNLSREGGWGNGPHSATEMYLARVPRGQVLDQPEFWTSSGWISDRRAATPILQRGWAEFPFQPRFMYGQWVALTAVNGYWGDRYEFDVADEPWGPWTTVASGPLLPRGADPAMNTYQAHVLPWRDAAGQVVVSVSNNARDMRRDAWPHPYRYRPSVFGFPWSEPPPVTTPPASSTTSTSTTSTTAATTTTVSAPNPPRSTTTTTTTVRPSTSAPTTATTVAPTTSSSPTSSTTSEPTTGSSTSEPTPTSSATATFS